MVLGLINPKEKGVRCLEVDRHGIGLFLSHKIVGLSVVSKGVVDTLVQIFNLNAFVFNVIFVRILSSTLEVILL